jgi:hypothetical protein
MKAIRGNTSDACTVAVKSTIENEDITTGIVITSLNQITEENINGRWVGHVARMGEKRNAYRILADSPALPGYIMDSRHELS